MEDWKAKEAARASAAAAMHAAFPHLVAAGPKCDSLNAAAKNIRIELKAAFPKVKFSVRSRRFSGGDAIDVSWIDGPCRVQVDEIIDKYSGGSFDGMTDSYNHSRSAWTDAFGDAKYVHSSRNDSDAAIASCIRTVAFKYAGNFKAAGVPVPSVEDYRRGKLWNVDIMDSGGADHWSLANLIGRELDRRCWALSKAVKVEEVAA